MEEWRDFAAMAGGVIGVLLGLLFVAVSLRLDHLAASRPLRSRVAQVMTLLMGIFVAVLVVTLPNPATWVAGIEILAVGVAQALALVRLDRKVRKEPHVLDPTENMLKFTSHSLLTSVLVIGTGIGLVFGQPAFLFALAAAVVTGLIGGIVSMWFVVLPPEKHPSE